MNSVFILRRSLHGARRLQAMLETTRGLRIAGVADTLYRARPLIARCDPDLLITDLGLEDGAALSLVNDLRRAQPITERPRVMLIAPSVKDALLFGTLCAGADSYLLEGAGEASVVASVGRLLRGEAAIAPPIAQHMLAFFGAASALSSTAPVNDRSLDWNAEAHNPLRLSAGEQRLLVLLAQGEAMGSVALRFGLSLEAVGRRVSNLYRKLQWEVRTGALTLHAA